MGIQGSEKLELQVIATGGHFDPNQGDTLAEILNDNIVISAQIPIVPEETNSVSITKALGTGLSSFGTTLDTLRPDIVVLLGDRSETLIAAVASTIAGIPIAHIHGGEITAGAIDDSFRHSITKMAHLHFVSEEEYRNRVIQLGETPESVIQVGALGHESIARMSATPREKLEDSLGVSFGDTNFLVTVHPETLCPENNPQLINSILAALDNFPKAHVLFTASNLDKGGQQIYSKILSYCAGRKNAYFVDSLGHENYLSVMKIAQCVIGNSSSGVIEAPAIGVATVNIGERQSGRLAPSTVFHSNADEGEITSAITRALNLGKRLDPSERLTTLANLPSNQIIDALENSNFEELRLKKFRDVDFSK